MNGSSSQVSVNKPRVSKEIIFWRVLFNVIFAVADIVFYVVAMTFIYHL